MNVHPLRALLVLVLGLCSVTTLQADLVWTPQDGWFWPSSAVAATPEEIHANADLAFEAKAYRDAAYGYQVLINTYPTYEQIDAVFVRKLEAQYLARDFDAALETIEVVLKRDPDSETLQRVLRSKYEIGSAYLTGTTRSILGIPFSAGSYGAEILDSIVQRYPFLPFSDDALFRVAEYYFGRKQYAEAEFVYEKLIQDYPQSDWVGLAEYQIGDAAFRRLKGVEYDMSPLDKAERYFNRYLSNHPGGDRADETRAILREIDELRAERLYRVARFYLRLEKSRAAGLYLQRILKEHPRAATANKARADLTQLAEGWVQE
ncbi:MAG: outer membrane protein assembly factor BamD [Planctomycetota bacterium]